MKEVSGFEKRFPRNLFTQKLIKMCKRLDGLPAKTITWTSRYIQGLKSNEITINKIWVVGSYARGALTCGDLDIVIAFEGKERYLAPSSEVIKGFFGRVQNTSFYEGTPEENSSGVAFPDAVEIWSGPGCNWMKALDSIVPDPSAGRANRPSDAIPLRLTQLNTTFEHIDEVIKLLSDGVLESEYIPFSPEFFDPLINHDEKYMLSAECYPPLGSATRKILPGIFRVIEERDHFYRYEIKDRTELRCGGTDVRVGKPYLPHPELFDDLSLKAVALVPHLSAKGPNGVWFLRRGPNHPLVKSFDNKQAFILTDDGKPSYIHHQDLMTDQNLCYLNIFSNKTRADEGLSSWVDGLDAEDAAGYAVKPFSGKELHDIVSGCDYVDFNQTYTPLNNYSAILLREDLCNVTELITSLLDVEQHPVSNDIQHPTQREVEDSPSFPS